MSTTISIGLYTALPRLPDAFAALVERLLLRSDKAHVRLLAGHELADSTAYPVPLTRTLMTNLVQQTLPSNQAIEVSMAYRLESHESIWLETYCYGQHFDGGWSVRFGGPIRLRMSYNQLCKDSVTHSDAGEKDDASQLFTYACGVGVEIPLGSEFDHGAMYLELGWPAPTGASMVYHRRISEFARDFARIYAEYHWGLCIVPTFESHFDFKQPALPPGNLPRLDRKDQPGKDHLAFLKQFQPGLVQFLDQLTEAQARTLARTPEKTISESLVDMSAELADVQMADFDTQGAAVMVRRQRKRGLSKLSVWPAYAYLAQHILSNPTHTIHWAP